MIAAKYGIIPCLHGISRGIQRLDGKGDDIILDPGSSHPRPTLHAEYAIACQRSVQASEYLKSMGINRIENASSPEPTLHLKYGMCCREALSGGDLDPAASGISVVEGQDPVMTIKYGMPCQSATANLNFLDGKGDNGLISPHNSKRDGGPKRYDMGLHFGKSSTGSGKGDDLTQYSGAAPGAPGFQGKQATGTNSKPTPDEKDQEIKVMFNPEKVEIEKQDPWSDQYGEGKGDHSTPNLEFTEGGPQVMGPHTEEPPQVAQRLVCQNCGRIAAPGFHNCGFCGGNVIPVSASPPSDK